MVLVSDGRTGRFFRTPAKADHAHAHDHARPAAPVSRIDHRLPLMQKVLGFHYRGRSVCVPVTCISSASSVLAIPSTELSVTVSGDGMITLSAPDSSAVPMVPAYWFAWHAAFPDGDLITDSLSHGL
jgi:hypothetical protein